MRMISNINMIGKSVDWDGGNRAVLNGSVKSDGVYLSDLASIKREGYVVLILVPDMLIMVKLFERWCLYAQWKSNESRQAKRTKGSIDFINGI